MSPRERSMGTLLGLAVGDALGSQFFVPENYSLLSQRELPAGEWQWTDDTEMASSVYAVLVAHGEIDQNALARSFAERYDFYRGYGAGAHVLLQLMGKGHDWRTLAAGLFDGKGSWGNGAAMRIAPLGAWFGGRPLVAARQAELASTTTHTHPEGIAGAVAVAVVASLIETVTDPADLLSRALPYLPGSQVGNGIRRAMDLVDRADPLEVAEELGNGRYVSAWDTVPFALWVAARNRGRFEAAFWECASVGGDIDTNCAIVGGLVASSPGGHPPEDWLTRTEPLPHWLEGAIPGSPASR